MRVREELLLAGRQPDTVPYPSAVVPWQIRHDLQHVAGNAARKHSLSFSETTPGKVSHIFDYFSFVHRNVSIIDSSCAQHFI